MFVLDLLMAQFLRQLLGLLYGLLILMVKLFKFIVVVFLTEDIAIDVPVGGSRQND